MTHHSIRTRYRWLVLAASLSQQQTFNDDYTFRLLSRHETQYHRISRVLELDRKRDLWIFEMEAMNWRCRDGEFLGWRRLKQEREGGGCDAGKDGTGGVLAEHV